MIDCLKFKPRGQWHEMQGYGVPFTRCGLEYVDESATLLWPNEWGLPPGRKCKECFPKEGE